MSGLFGVVVLSLSASLSTSAGSPQSPKPPASPADTWAPLRFLVGTWEGTSSGQPGHGTVRREYRLILRDRFIEGRSTSTYPPQDKNPKGEVHEDIAYLSYDRRGNAFKMRQFHVEGFVTEYVARPTGSSDIVFTSEGLGHNVPLDRRPAGVSLYDRLAEFLYEHMDWPHSEQAAQSRRRVLSGVPSDIRPIPCPR